MSYFPVLEQIKVDVGNILDELIRAYRDQEDFCLFESGRGENEVILGIGSKSTFTLQKADSQSLELFQNWLNQQEHPMDMISKMESKTCAPTTQTPWIFQSSVFLNRKEYSGRLAQSTGMLWKRQKHPQAQSHYPKTGMIPILVLAH